MSRAVLTTPVLAGAFAVLLLYAHNVDQVVGLFVLPVPLLAAVGGAALLTVVLWLIFKDAYTASFVGAAWVLLFFSYGHVRNAIDHVEVAGMDVGRSRYLLPVFAGLVAVTGLLAFTRWRAGFGRLMPAVTLALAALILYNVTTIGLHYLGKWRESTPSSAKASDVVSLPPGNADRPDIYYIVPDRYASKATLADYFGYDNTAFLERLEAKGFYVADESLANYHKTFLSLAASLNMRYMDDLRQEVGEETQDETPVYDLIQDHAVERTLKKQGYDVLHFGTWWGPTRYNHDADLNVNYFPKFLGRWELDGFSQLVLNTTALEPIQAAFLPGWYEQQRIRELYKFERLKEIASMEGPKFVFVHVLLPHDPFVFGPNGEEAPTLGYSYESKSLAPERVRTLNERYVDQLTFTNTLLEEAIDTILAESVRPPVIILQADEGPFTEESEHREPLEWSEATLRTRLGILNAYYLPNGGREALYPTVSPVNSFRVVFNEYFGAQLPLLDDKAHVWSSADRIYDFVDVTDRARPAGR